VSKTWNVLVVDDEPDVHSVTKIALRRKHWKGRAIALTSAHSGAEARKLLEAEGCPLFHAALVDVVMETSDAGLKLCEYLRNNYPPSLRIVLRTGQPGHAPEEEVLTTYDIDYYLAKTEVTEQRLFGTLRACFRNSQDMLGALAMSNHLRALTSALRDPHTSMESLRAIMNKNLEFLEDKYDAKLTFVQGDANPDDPDHVAAIQAIQQAHTAGLATMTLLDASTLGLPAGTSLVVTHAPNAPPEPAPKPQTRIGRWFSSILDKPAEPKAVSAGGGGGVVVVPSNPWPTILQREFLLDLELFMANWRLIEEVFADRAAAVWSQMA
jgi:CheY-like chemotaxis protein